MQVLTRPWGAMHYHAEGKEGQTLVFANSLGTDLRLWDKVIPALSQNYRCLRFDKRGHGLSSLSTPYTIADLAEDAAALIEAEATGPVVFVGLSIGGMIGQSLAATRPDLVSALVLSNTAHAMGSPEAWAARIKAVENEGIGSIANTVMERWFAPSFLSSPERALWQNMLERSSPQGYIEACRAIAAENLADACAALRLPVQMIAGSEDGSSPPSLVRSTAALIHSARYSEIDGAGHLPPVESPEDMVRIIQDFLKDIA